MTKEADASDIACIAIGEERDDSGRPLVRALGPGVIGTVEEVKAMVSAYEAKARTDDMETLAASISELNSQLNLLQFAVRDLQEEKADHVTVAALRSRLEQLGADLPDRVQRILSHPRRR